MANGQVKRKECQLRLLAFYDGDGDAGGGGG